jgi:gliding motility-associated-like protein
MKHLFTSLMLLWISTLLTAQTFNLTAFDRPEGYELQVDGEQEIRLIINGFEAGDNYGIQLRNKPGNGTFDYGALPDGTQKYKAGFIGGSAKDESIDLCISSDLEGPGTLYLNLRKNRGFNQYKSSSSPFEVVNSKNLDSLLNVVFRNESCFELFPDTIITGDLITNDGRRVMQTGVFNGGMEVFGMESGIILSTGAVTDAVGPNSLVPRSQNFNGNNDYEDPDAAVLIPPNFCTQLPGDPPCYEDVVVLEFEFIPTTDSISFNYIFFSEEYCFALNAGFGDAFAFYLEGPNVLPNGRANIARLANGDQVSSETLNHITTPSLFVDNSASSFVPCTGAANDPAIEAQVAYDGFSEKLQIKAAVTPCERHVLKLMVIDALDFNLDSGILLEAGSFTAGLIADPEPSVQGLTGSVTPIEACDTATITFRRLFSDSSDIALPLEVKYNLITTGGGLNLADDGFDFELPPSPFTIPAGDTTAVMQIPILGDLDNAEGIEAFIIKYDGTCNCDQNRDTFYIQDAVDLVLNPSPDQSVCAGQEVLLELNVQGGAAPYEYMWPDGQDTSRVTYTSNGQDSTIIISVIDSCGQVGLDSILIIAPDISATSLGDFSLCSMPTATIPIDVEGVGPFTITLRVDSNGVVTNTNYVISGDTTFVFDRSAIVNVTAVADASGCGGAATGTATVVSAGVALTSTVIDPNCDDNTGSISLNLTGGNANFTYDWSDSGPANANRAGLAAGAISVDIARLTEPTCIETFNFTLNPPAALVIDSFDYVRPDCPGENIDIAAVVSGGTPPYTYIWPGEIDVDSILSITTLNGNNTYSLIVTNDCGVETTGSVNINLPAFSAELSGRFSLCNNTPTLVPLTIIGPVGNYNVSIEFVSGGITDTVDQLLPTGVTNLPIPATATITILSITNVDGCAGDTTVGIATVVDPQISFENLVAQINCNGASTGSISLTNPATVPVSFAWSDAGSATASRTGLPAGMYSVTITDQEDATCFRDTTFLIEEPGVLAVSVLPSSALPSCSGEVVTLAAAYAGGAAPITINWDNGASPDSLFTFTTEPGMTEYPLLITDNCGNEIRDTFRFDLPDVQAQVSGNFSVCNVPSVDVAITLSGSTSYTFTIRENGMDRTLTVTGDTSLTYTEATEIQLISVMGVTGCAGLAGGIANVTDATFDVEAIVTDILCAGQPTGTISLNVNNNPSGFSYAWDRPQLSGPDVTGLTAGNYSVTITELTPSACLWDTTITIIEPPTAITFLRDSSRDESCTNLAFASANYNGGTGMLTYLWSNGTPGEILGDVIAGMYDLTITDENGCQIVQAFNLQDRRTTILANISASAAELSCSQTSLVISAQQNTVATSYQWRDENGTPVGNSRDITITSPGSYSVFVEQPSTGCFATDTIVITESGDQIQLELPVISALNCDNQVVDLTVSHPDFTGTVTYEWRLNNAVVGNGATLPNISVTGIYEVTVIRQDNGCPSVATTEVLVDRVDPTVNVAVPVVTGNCISPEVLLAVSANGPYTFSWSTADGNLTGLTNEITATADRPGTYAVLVRDTLNGCSTTRDVQVIQDGDLLTALAGTDQTLVCTGQGTILFGNFVESLAGSTGRWYSPSGAIISEARQAFATEAGAFVFEAIHPVSGCSSFDTVMVINEGPSNVEYTLQQPPCPEVGGRLFVTSVTGNNGPFTFTSPTGQTDPWGNSLRGLVQGNNVLVVTDQLGCTFLDTFQIFDFGEFIGVAEDVSVRLGEEAVLGVETNRGDGALVQWMWGNLPDTSACVGCPEPSLRPLESFIATVAVTDTNGCVLTLRQNVLVSEQELVYMPTAFSPNNGDGTNDVYTVFGDPQFVTEVTAFGIFDRWGGQVFGNNNFQVNDPDFGWDGMTKGKEAQIGVYVYTLTVQYFDGTEKTLRGSFTLVR